MGPTSVDVGRSSAAGGAGLPATMGLQWGRHQSMSEGGSAADGEPSPQSLASMGPTSVDVGGALPSCVARLMSASVLQWGRHQSMSEGGRVLSRLVGRASMLQWGRHQSMSEGCWSVYVSRTSRCFNGADISRCRRVSGEKILLDLGSGFNGADISRCRRDAARWSEANGMPLVLQWGRHQSMSEGGRSRARWS